MPLGKLDYLHNRSYENIINRTCETLSRDDRLHYNNEQIVIEPDYQKERELFAQLHFLVVTHGTAPLHYPRKFVSRVEQLTQGNILLGCTYYYCTQLLAP